MFLGKGVSIPLLSIRNIHTCHTWLADLVQSGYLVRMLVFTHDMNSLKTWMAWRGKVKGNGGRVLTWMCIIILGYYGGRTKKCHEISYIFYPLAGMFHTFTSRDQSCQNNIYGSKLSGWEILTFCVNFCQFSLWHGVKMSNCRAEKKYLVGKYTKESDGIALFLLQICSI